MLLLKIFETLLPRKGQGEDEEWRSADQDKAEDGEWGSEDQLKDKDEERGSEDQHKDEDEEWGSEDQDKDEEWGVRVLGPTQGRGWRMRVWRSGQRQGLYIGGQGGETVT